MRWTTLAAVFAALGPAAPLAAQERAPTINAAGTGRVTTPPDLATIAYRIVGEGATSDAAVAAMVARRQAIDAGLAGRIGAAPTGSEVAVTEVRGPACRGGYGQRLSTGDCAIGGYVASASVAIRTPAVKDAGTLVGLLARLGASEPRLSGFTLADPAAAQARAIRAALADARAHAEAIAAAAGARLGRLVNASTGGYYGGDVFVSGTRVVSAPPPPPPPAPIAVDLTPRPIETQVQVSVTYEIAAP